MTRPTVAGIGRTLGGLALLALAGAAGAEQRRFELGLDLPVTRLSQLDQTDLGLGLRLGRALSPAVALEALLAHSPGDLGDPAFSGSRSQALAGLKLGRAGERGGFFLTARGGLTRFGRAPEPIACILIFPPPLACRLAGGDTLPTLALGGGFELALSSGARLRLEASDQLLRYPGPVLDGGGRAREQDFWDHDLRLSVGLGWRF